MLIEDLSIIIVTFNEENNIRECVESGLRITKKIFVVDSFSTDKTIEILDSMGIAHTSHPYITYAKKRNWAQENNPYQTEWVLHIDADERINDDMYNWFQTSFFKLKDEYDGFLFSRKPIFMGKFLKHGGVYPTYTPRLFKTQKGHCEDKAYDQHFVVEGKVATIKKVEILNDVTPSINKFIDTHNFFSNYEAREIYSGGAQGEVKPKLLGNPLERRRWLKRNIFERAPLFSRAFLYFFYRYFIRLGFLDGKEGFIFHVLQGFWFRFLIDAKVYELKKQQQKLS
ncbi:MAG TPA: glycosyltransferase family 2 protein [Bacteroidales bacterium]